MKCLILSYFIALVLFGNIINLKLTENKNDITLDDSIKKSLNCKICQEMFQYDFNYEKFLKDELKLNSLKSQFEELLKNKFYLKKYFTQDNLETVSKEISMEYFFKGEESQFSNQENMEKFKSCKILKSGIDINCDNLKLKLCENILSYENEICFKKIYKENDTTPKEKRIIENKNKNINDLNESQKLKNPEENLEINFNNKNNSRKQSIESNSEKTSNEIDKKKKKFHKDNIDIDKNLKSQSKINIIIIY